MKVRFQRAYRYEFGDKKYEMIREAVRFFLDHHKLNDYNCSVDFYVNSPDVLKKSGCSGMIMVNRSNDQARIHVKHTVFFGDVLNTIFHELTHLKQHLTGDLVADYHYGRDIWKGTPFPVMHMNSANFKYSHYHKLPWEVEARAVAREMVKLFKQYRKPKKTFWQKLKFWSI